MRRISSGFTVLQKSVFPVMWFGFLAFFIGMVLFASNDSNRPPFFFVIVPIGMGLFGFFLFKKMLWDLADEVLDEGDWLVVRFRREEERIPLSNIMNVGYANMTSPQRVTLTLRTPCRFGKEVSFAPPQTWVPFGRSRVVDDLIERVDAARVGRG
jgi:hypothetical protein